MNITVQGAVRVNSCPIAATGNRVVALSVDLRSKYAKIVTYGNEGEVPTIVLGADEDTLDIDLSKRQVFTELQFPEYAGYDVFSASVNRYILRVCFVRRKKRG